jgi:hypothetical protein
VCGREEAQTVFIMTRGSSGWSYDLQEGGGLLTPSQRQIGERADLLPAKERGCWQNAPLISPRR